MTAFVDTSALYALLNEDDLQHGRAVAGLRQLRGEGLVTHSYVVVEACTLVARRMGWPAVERLTDTFLPLIEIRFVDEPLHGVALATFRASGSTRVSLVDWTSFAFMRREGVERAFAFDDDFARQGFQLVA